MISSFGLLWIKLQRASLYKFFFFCKHVFISLELYLEIELLGHRISVWFFKKLEVFQIGCTNTSNVWELHTLTSIFNFSYSSFCIVVSHRGFNLYFPDDYVEYLFMYLLAFVYLSLWSACSSHLPILFALFLMDLQKFFIYSGLYKSLLRYMFYKYILQSVYCPFIFVMVSFNETKYLILMKSDSSEFFYCSYHFLWPMKPLPTPKLQGNFHMVYSFMFKSMVHLELIFMNAVK